MAGRLDYRRGGVLSTLTGIFEHLYKYFPLILSFFFRTDGTARLPKLIGGGVEDGDIPAAAAAAAFPRLIDVLNEGDGVCVTELETPITK